MHLKSFLAAKVAVFLAVGTRSLAQDVSTTIVASGCPASGPSSGDCVTRTHDAPAIHRITVTKIETLFSIPDYCITGAIAPASTSYPAIESILNSEASKAQEVYATGAPPAPKMPIPIFDNFTALAASPSTASVGPPVQAANASIPAFTSPGQPISPPGPAIPDQPVKGSASNKKIVVAGQSAVGGFALLVLAAIGYWVWQQTITDHVEDPRADN